MSPIMDFIMEVITKAGIKTEKQRLWVVRSLTRLAAADSDGKAY